MFRLLNTIRNIWALPHLRDNTSHRPDVLCIPYAAGASVFRDNDRTVHATAVPEHPAHGDVESYHLSEESSAFEEV